MITLSKKVCLLGDFAVGKTSLVRRFVYDLFDDRYISTIGVKVSRKTVTVACEHDVVELNMMLWDLAGSEEFNQMRVSYLRGASGVLLVGDLARPATFASLPNYLDEVRRFNPDASAILAANKVDRFNEDEGDRAALQTARALAETMDVPLYLTSAMTGDAVEQAFRHLGRVLIKELG